MNAYQPCPRDPYRPIPGGTRFGWWVVLGPRQYRRAGVTYLRCRCRCGAELYVSRRNLTSKGKNRSTRCSRCRDRRGTKMTQAERKAAADRYRYGDETLAQVAAVYGVTPQYVHALARRKWRPISNPSPRGAGGRTPRPAAPVPFDADAQEGE